MEFYGVNIEKYDKNMIHDFDREMPLVKVLGVHSVIKKPKVYFVLNIILLVIVVILYAFFTTTAIITVSMSSTERLNKIIVLQFISFIGCALALPVIKFTHFSQLGRLMRTLKSIVFSYDPSWEDDELTAIRARRVRQVRTLSLAATALCYLNVITTAFQYPLTQYFLQEKSQNPYINPFMPVPIFIPYATDTIPTFVFTFLAESLFFFVFYSSVISYVDIYLSATLQLVAQLEILNHSLRNIDIRAYKKLQRDRNLKDSSELPSEKWYEKTEFQSCFSFCLRENIQHHHAILRYANLLKSYLEPINTVVIAVFSIIFALSVVPALENPIRNTTMIVFVVGECIGFFLLSWLGQLVIDKSSETYSALYSTPWYLSNKNFKLIFNVMLTNVREPLALKSQWIKTTTSFENFADMMVIAYKLMNVMLNK